MLVSLVTINRDNADGLRTTLESVAAQRGGIFEHIIVDGASTDNSVNFIVAYAQRVPWPVRWLSEPDTGIYNAMNKGLRMASGRYVQVLNSGDTLAAPDVMARVASWLKGQAAPPAIARGNMLKRFPDGRVVRDKGPKGEISMYTLYSGTVNHNSAWIRRDLFNRYGSYDETLRVVSDWKWFLTAMVTGVRCPDGTQVPPLRPDEVVYTDTDMTTFDMTGISETCLALRSQERRSVLESLLPAPVLSDYDRYWFDVCQMERLRRYTPLYKLVWFVERTLNRWERWRGR